jgi:thioredoxin-like negative regulator of GroEL
MTTFDAPDTTLPCGRRDVTTVAPQALALLNNAFVHEQSESLARRVREQSGDRNARVRLAWRLALARDPRSSETTAALAHLAAQVERLGEERALASLCHVLLNTNEFVYVD